MRDTVLFMEGKKSESSRGEPEREWALRYDMWERERYISLLREHLGNRQHDEMGRWKTSDGSLIGMWFGMGCYVHAIVMQGMVVSGCFGEPDARLERERILAVLRESVESGATRPNAKPTKKSRQKRERRAQHLGMLAVIDDWWAVPETSEGDLYSTTLTIIGRGGLNH